MEMISERTVPASRDAVWAALNAPEVLQSCIAGCEKLELVGDNVYDVGMAIRIGPVAAKFQGKMKLTDIVAPHSYAITFEGQGGMAGFAKGSALVKLSAVAGGLGTSLQYEVRAQVGGKLAQLGARLIDSSARKMADDFFSRFVLVFPPSAAEAVSEMVADAAPAEQASDGEEPERTLWERIRQRGKQTPTAR